MKRGDILIGLVLIVIIVWVSIPIFQGHEESQATTAIIEVDGELFKTVSLTDEVQDIEIITERGYNLLRISNKGIEMIEADCPDQLCLGFGHVHRENENIVCLPNRIFVEVTGDALEGDGLDAIVS